MWGIAAKRTRSGHNIYIFKYSLEDLFGREVDLLEEQTIKNPYLKKNLDATKMLIYNG